MALSHGVFRLLPWSSSLGVNKLTPDMLVSPTQHKSPVMGSAPLQLLKRKRSDNHEIFTVLDGPPPTKRRVDIPNQTSPMEVDGSNSASVTTPPPSSREAAHGPNSTSSGHTQTTPELKQPTNDDNANLSQRANIPTKKADIDMDMLRQSLDAQLSLEVLLKHNELRLIDQEIAKCQIALEQLRRCSEIPYPGSSADGISQSVSNGSGYATPYSGSGPPPVSPTPWGVADGPYSRHYAKWLLPDPRFDGGESPELSLPNAAASWDGRSTRGSFTENGYVAGKSRAQRASMSTRLQSLPTGYPAPKEKAGPMVIKRKSDNKLVKLVCLDCRRYDFSSTQGFINHCRIAHSRTFASHDAAAEACGEPVDVDEAGVVIGGTAEPATISTPGSVHPLIRSAHTIEKTPKSTPDVQPSNANQTPVAKVEKAKKRATPPFSFKASPDAPHLSTMLAGLGSKLNLDEIVGDAKKMVDLSEFMSEGESEDEDESSSQELQAVSGARLPARTTMPQAASQRPTSSKRHEASHITNMPPHSPDVSTPTKATPYSPPRQFSQATSLPSALNLEGSNSDAVRIDENLSPLTVESNQAPSLVSDNEDEFEVVSDSESLSSRSSNDGHDDDDLDDVEVEDDEGTTASTNKTAHEVTSLKRSQDKKRDRVLQPAIVSLNRGGKRSRRVSFASEQDSPSKSKKATNPKKRH